MTRGIRQPGRAPQDNFDHKQDQQQPRPPKQGGLPLWMGLAIGAFILCASAGVTFFFLTKPPENQRLYDEGQRQLKLGQYAFAMKTLAEAVKIKPDDPKAMLALARAYVGVEQVDKAWDLIVQAQQMGMGVVAEPELASDLANYYRQHGQFQRAVELLRPLAANNIAGKKAELADLDAAWGDQCIQDGDVKQAQRCWEEVRDMHEGSRFTEADSRLATVYQKIGEEMQRKGDGDEALKYFAKLNAMNPSASSLERTADLYEKQGKLELAIDQLRKATKLSSDSSMINRKLAMLMAARGKELLDTGEADSGYGYLQQAQALDPKAAKAPSATMRNVHIGIDPDSGSVKLNGEVWNPSTDPINSLVVRGELFDTKAARSLWSKDIRVIDEFVPPLASREARPLEIITGVATADPASSELRIYINGSLYRAYPLSKGGNSSKISGDATPSNVRPTLRPRLAPPENIDTVPLPAPDRVIERDSAPTPAPNSAPTPGSSSEEKTLKDLE